MPRCVGVIGNHPPIQIGIVGDGFGGGENADRQGLGVSLAVSSLGR